MTGERVTGGTRSTVERRIFCGRVSCFFARRRILGYMTPEFRVFLLRRPVANPLPATFDARAVSGALAAIFVPKLVEFAIGGIGSLLKKAGSDESSTIAGGEITSLYRTNGDMVLAANEEVGAIVGVWGLFANQDGRRTPPSDVALLNLERAGLVPQGADIDIIFEALIRRTPDNTAFYLETRHFSVRKFISNRGGERSFVATFAVTTPTATAEGDTIALGNINLGRVGRNESLIPDGLPEMAYPRLRSNLMPWQMMSRAAKSAYDADVATGKARDALYMPVGIRLSLTETADGNKFLFALGEILEGAKQEAATEISKRILPEDPEKVKEENAKRANAVEQLYIDELDAEIAYRTAERDFNAADEANKPIKEVERQKAKRRYERATQLRKAAGVP